jgi:Peptidase family M28
MTSHAMKKICKGRHPATAPRRGLIALFVFLKETDVLQRILPAAAACAALASVAAPPGTPSPEIAKMVEEISAKRMEATIRKLVSFGTRSSLSDATSETRGVGAARNWIKAELERCARDSGGRLEVAFDSHHIESAPRVAKPTDIVNVVATLPGTQAESKDRIYVVSGHYDSMPSTPIDPTTDAPGANDDASGTAAVMEIACILSKHRFDATLVFMAVAGEEQGLLGSKGWAEAAKAKGLDVAGMFTNDIIGNTKGGDGTVVRDRMRLFAEGVPPLKALPDDTLAVLRTGGENDLPTRQLARYVKDAAEKYVPQLKVDVIYRRDRYLRGGDHFSFLDNGYAALRFTEGIEDWRHQHQSPRVEDGVQFGDLPEFVDYEYAANVARVNLAALASLANAPSAPKEVGVENVRYESNTTLRWKANPEPDVAGYRIVWRETTSPFWQHAKDVGTVTRETIMGVSRDNFLFGLQAYDRDGNVSVTTYPRPWRPAP